MRKANLPELQIKEALHFLGYTTNPFSLDSLYVNICIHWRFPYNCIVIAQPILEGPILTHPMTFFLFVAIALKSSQSSCNEPVQTDSSPSQLPTDESSLSQLPINLS